MKKTSNKLFDLIKSLTKTEKRHFSKYCTKYSNTKDLTYLNLYKEIDKMKVYDIAKLNKKFGEKNIKTNSTYLYNQLLTSLRVLYRESSFYRSLLNSIIDINILMVKGLFEQAEKIIDKSIKISEKHNEIFLRIRLIEMKLQLLKIKNRKVNYYKNTLELKEKYETALIAIRKKLKLGFYVGNFVHLMEKEGSH